jgi:hypothetical protein
MESAEMRFLRAVSGYKMEDYKCNENGLLEKNGEQQIRTQ